MNILFLDAYFYPEKIAYTHLENDLIEQIVNDGHNIFVICPTPTRGITEEVRIKYKKVKNESLKNGKLRVARFWAPKEKKNPVVRAFRYLWCNIRAYHIAVQYKDIDIVFSNSTPPTQGALGGKVAKSIGKKCGKKIPFVYNLQDIFPDSLINTGLTKQGSFLWRIGRKIEDYTYQNADRIVVISEGFKRNIIKKGVTEEKIEVISNWIDVDEVYPIKRENNRLISELNIDRQKYIVVYAGNFGAVQGADIILQVANRLQKETEIQFVIFGGGAYFEEAKKEARQLRNVVVQDLLPPNRISEVYSLGDVALITCKSGTGNAGMPSKLWSIMACNTPIIASFDLESDLADAIHRADAGICVEPENIEALVNGILWMKNNFVRTSNNIRNFVCKVASKEKCVQKNIQLLNEIYVNNQKCE